MFDWTTVGFFCRGGWWAFRNNCYKVMAESIPNLDDALARCETDGAYLADIRDLKEYNFVIALLSHYTWENTYFNSVWVGAGDTQQEGTYIWFHDNSPISSDVLIWVPGEPYAPIDQDCLNVIVDANNFGKFDDDSCMGVKQRSGLICKKESY